jgi:ABC-2 type transport system permease protein
MKAFFALVHREFIEHRGAFFIAPLVLVGVVFALTLLAFSVDRLDTRFSGQLLTVVPTWVFEAGFAGLSAAWVVYLGFVLFFYCADGFAADKRNNAMLFWKSMPVSDLKVLMSKLAAALTILPGAVFAVGLVSILLMFGVAYITTMFAGLGNAGLLGTIAGIYAQMALVFLVVLVCGLMWYLPYMALVGAMGSAVGRWAIPLALLLPTVVSALEWVTLGGMHPFATRTWAYLDYRSQMPVSVDYLDNVWEGQMPFDATLFITDFLQKFDWLQVGIGAVFALVVIYLAAEYRRRAPAN